MGLPRGRGRTGSPASLELGVVGTDIREDSRRYTVFVLEARLGERVWTVEKRFQDFCRFDAQLRRELAATRQMVDGVVPPLPRRVPAIAIDNALRAQQLDLYCKTLCVHVAAAQAVRAHGMTRGRHVINDGRSNCEEVEQAVLMVLVHNLYGFVDFKQQCGVSSPGSCHGMAQERHAAVDPPGVVGSLDRQTLDITHDLPHSSTYQDEMRAREADAPPQNIDEGEYELLMAAEAELRKLIERLSDAEHCIQAHADTKRSLGAQVVDAQAKILALRARTNLGAQQLAEAQHGSGAAGATALELCALAHKLGAAAKALVSVLEQADESSADSVAPAARETGTGCACGSGDEVEARAVPAANVMRQFQEVQKAAIRIATSGPASSSGGKGKMLLSVQTSELLAENAALWRGIAECADTRRRLNAYVARLSRPGSSAPASPAHPPRASVVASMGTDGVMTGCSSPFPSQQRAHSEGSAASSTSSAFGSQTSHTMLPQSSAAQEWSPVKDGKRRQRMQEPTGTTLEADEICTREQEEHENEGRRRQRIHELSGILSAVYHSPASLSTVPRIPTTGSMSMDSDASTVSNSAQRTVTSELSPDSSAAASTTAAAASAQKSTELVEHPLHGLLQAALQAEEVVGKRGLQEQAMEGRQDLVEISREIDADAIGPDHELGEDIEMRACDQCGVSGSDLSLQRCARCKVVWYCSRGCQAAAWVGGHRQECARLSHALSSSPAQRSSASDLALRAGRDDVGSMDLPSHDHEEGSGQASAKKVSPTRNQRQPGLENEDGSWDETVVSSKTVQEDKKQKDQNELQPNLIGPTIDTCATKDCSGWKSPQRKVGKDGRGRLEPGTPYVCAKVEKNCATSTVHQAAVTPSPGKGFHITSPPIGFDDPDHVRVGEDFVPPSASSPTQMHAGQKDDVGTEKVLPCSVRKHVDGGYDDPDLVGWSGASRSGGSADPSGVNERVASSGQVISEDDEKAHADSWNTHPASMVAQIKAFRGGLTEAGPLVEEAASGLEQHVTQVAGTLTSERAILQSELAAFRDIQTRITQARARLQLAEQERSDTLAAAAEQAQIKVATCGRVKALERSIAASRDLATLSLGVP